jgi:hypothetical protein
MQKLVLLLVMISTGILTTGVALADDCTAYDITYGQSCTAALTAASTRARDGSRLEFWAFRNASVGCVSIQMDAPFTPYLQLLEGSRGGPVVREGASPLQIPALEAGTYFIKVTSAGSGERTGAYTLSLSRC